MAIGNTTSVTAELLYFIPPPNGEKPYFFINNDSTTGARRQNFEREPHQIEIENLRGKEGTASLDTTGFQFFRHPQRYTAFTDDAEIEREYYPESIELVKQLTGASRIVPFDHSMFRPDFPLHELETE